MNQPDNMSASTSNEAVGGRRRALIVEHTLRDSPQPEQPRSPSAIADAVGYAEDRLDRVEHVLGDLNGVLMRLGHDLSPVLTGGGYAEPDGIGDAVEVELHVDRRSTVARSVTALGDRADRLANIVGYCRDRASAIVDALELGGVE